MAQFTLDKNLWKGVRVLLTGHTGFKGSWMLQLLSRLGAEVFGLSLKPEGTPNLFDILEDSEDKHFAIEDIRNLNSIRKVLEQSRPEIVIHMAAQSLVTEGYANPIDTIESNIMGTVNLLEALRATKELKSLLVITSDKVYENNDQVVEFSESSHLGGYDPYSASKAAVEILTSAYYRSYFRRNNIPVITGRAGNVIGGGDWAANRLIPDLYRSFESKQKVVLRDPDAVRPWQHVLDPLYGYLLYIQKSLTHISEEIETSLNFGPPRDPVYTVKEVAEMFSSTLGELNLVNQEPHQISQHESHFLSINSSRALQAIGWKTSLATDTAIKWTADWYSAYYDQEDMQAFTAVQIDKFALIVNDTALLLR